MTIKCAKWCGRGCTEAEYDAACKVAAGIVCQLKGKWVPIVWENLGWHACAKTPDGRLKVHPSFGDDYTAYLSCDDSPGGEWTARGTTPQEAVNKVIQQARARATEIIAMLDAVATSLARPRVR